MPGHKDWIIKASADLRAARRLISNDGSDDDFELLGIAAYHTHQCAEKALKAILTYYHQKIPKTHDLDGLLEECKKHDPQLIVFKQHIDFLSPYEMRTRYPDDRFSIDRDEALEAIKHAGLILKTIAQCVRVSL